jgi:hypothetical protein
MAKLNKKQKEAKTLDFGSTVRKAQGGDALAAEQLKKLTAADIDYNKDFGNLNKEDLQWLNNNVPNLKDITDQAFEDYAIRNNITKDEAVNGNADIADAMKAASAENRVEQADKASKADDKWNPVDVAGSGNKKQIAQGNLDEDRPLTKEEERRAYDSSITDDESKDVDALQNAIENIKNGDAATTGENKPAVDNGNAPASVNTNEEKPAEDEITTDESVNGAAFNLGKKVDDEGPTTPTGIEQFSKDLNKFVIQAYLNGDFGKRSDPNAIATMGFYVLDKIGAALVNASQVARGMSPTAKSQWGQILEKETDLFGKKITAEWWKTLDPETKAAMLRTGGVEGTSAKNVYENTDDTAVENAKKKDILEVSKLEQEQRTVAQANLNALLQRKTEIQVLINKLESDQGWGSYVEAMNAVVGTARGLETLGVAISENTQSTNGFANTLSGDVATGGIPSKFVKANISDSATWNNSNATSRGNNSSLNKDALALAKYGSAEAYAKAGKDAQVNANKNLINELKNQIKIIDACINAWGKDLNVTSTAE